MRHVGLQRPQALQNTPVHAVAFTTEAIFAYRAAAGSAFFLWHAKDRKHQG